LILFVVYPGRPFRIIIQLVAYFFIYMHFQGLPSMYDPVVALIAQGQLHINPPIKIIGSYEDL